MVNLPNFVRFTKKVFKNLENKKKSLYLCNALENDEHFLSIDDCLMV